MQIKEEAMNKAELRAHFDSMRQGLSAQYRQKTDIEIISRFLCSEVYAKAELLLTYVSVGAEVDTIGLINAAFANGKSVAVPKCMDGNTMDFYIIKSMDDLTKGKYGLLEPDVNKCKKAEVTEDTVCIVPALSFDAKGHRLGMGGGYYDRFLKNFKGTSVGFCRSSFLRLNLPWQEHDVPVDIIVTEEFLRILNQG